MTEPARTVLKRSPLTPNEVTVVRSRLGSDSSESEEDRIRHSGLPRTTYMEAKQRLYARKVLLDCYIPNAEMVPLDGVRFTLAQVYADKIGEAANALLADPGTVVAWAGIHSIFGVTLYRKGTENSVRKARDSLLSLGPIAASIFDVTCAPTPKALPVYFDYEGSWNHLIGLTSSRRWPRAFPGPSRGGGRGWFHLGRPSPEEVKSLVGRTLPGVEQGRGAHLHGPATLPRSQRRMLDSGLVEWRTMISMSEVTGPKDRPLTDGIFVAGTLLEQGALPSLVRELAERQAAFPFFAASDGQGALLGFLSSTIEYRPDPPPMRTSASAFQILNGYLKDIVVVREPLSQLNILRQHRYDGLF